MSQQLHLDLGDQFASSRGHLRAQVQLMVAELDQAGRLSPSHAPLVGLLYRLADALEGVGGRGASVAMLAKEYRETWRTLSEARPTVEEDTAGEAEYDVVFLTEAEPDT